MEGVCARGALARLADGDTEEQLVSDAPEEDEA